MNITNSIKTGVGTRERRKNEGLLPRHECRRMNWAGRKVKKIRPELFQREMLSRSFYHLHRTKIRRAMQKNSLYFKIRTAMQKKLLAFYIKLFSLCIYIISTRIKNIKCHFISRLCVCMRNWKLFTHQHDAQQRSCSPHDVDL